MTTYRQTLLRLVSEQDDDERIRLAELFASQLEVDLEAHADRSQAAILATDEHFVAKIDDVQAQVGYTNTLVSTFIEQALVFQQDARAAWEDNGARLGKLEVGQDALAGQLRDLGEHVDTIDLRDQARYAESLHDRKALRVELDHLAARVEALETERLRILALGAHAGGS